MGTVKDLEKLIEECWKIHDQIALELTEWKEQIDKDKEKNKCPYCGK